MNNYCAVNNYMCPLHLFSLAKSIHADIQMGCHIYCEDGFFFGREITRFFGGFLLSLGTLAVNGMNTMGEISSGEPRYIIIIHMMSRMRATRCPHKRLRKRNNKKDLTIRPMHQRKRYKAIQNLSRNDKFLC